MFQRQWRLILSWNLPLVLVLVGCGTMNKSAENPRPYWTVQNPDASKGASRGSSARLSRDATRENLASSSLDALQRDQSTATPASSPLNDVHFEFDRYDLQAKAHETLRANAEWLKANPVAQVQVEGHCDARGTDEYNLALGAKRAQAAKDYLVTLGIAADRLSTVSYGEEVPVCREQTEACWEQNRRSVRHYPSAGLILMQTAFLRL